MFTEGGQFKKTVGASLFLSLSLQCRGYIIYLHNKLKRLLCLVRGVKCLCVAHSPAELVNNSTSGSNELWHLS